MKRLATIAIVMTIALAGTAYATCNSPTGQAGQMVYAGNANIMVYCDGTNWVSMSGGVSVTIGGTSYNNTPGGSANQVQYNNGSGGFAGDSGLTYSGGLLTVTNLSTTNISATTLYVTSSAQVGGSVQIGGSGSETCSSAADYGKTRRNPISGHMQVCQLR